MGRPRKGAYRKLLEEHAADEWPVYGDRLNYIVAVHGVVVDAKTEWDPVELQPVDLPMAGASGRQKPRWQLLPRRR